MCKFLNANKGVKNIQGVGDQKTIYYDNINSFDDKNYSIIQAKAFVGGYGNKYDIIDFKSGNKSYQKKFNDTDAFPLHFIIAIPEINSNSSDIGFMVFEKFKKRGAKGFFATEFSDYFKTKFNDYRIEIEPIVPEEVLTYLEKGGITETVIKGYQIPKNIEDDFESGTSTNKRLSVTLTIKGRSPTKRMIDRITKAIKNKKHGLNQLFTGELIGPHEIKLKSTYNGQEKTIVLKDDEEMLTPGLDITDQIKISITDGYPEDSSIYPVEYEYIERLKETINRD